MPNQFDVLFLQVDSARVESGPQRVAMSFGTTTKYVTGIQKSVQSFLALLLTKSGEAWNEDAGCGFLAALEQGLIRTELDAVNYFTKDVPELLAQVNEGVEYSDEYLVSAVLVGVTVEQSKLTLRIKLTTAAGDDVTFLAPV